MNPMPTCNYRIERMTTRVRRDALNARARYCPEALVQHIDQYAKLLVNNPLLPYSPPGLRRSAFVRLASFALAAALSEPDPIRRKASAPLAPDPDDGTPVLFCPHCMRNGDAVPKYRTILGNCPACFELVCDMCIDPKAAEDRQPPYPVHRDCTFNPGPWPE